MSTATMATGPILDSLDKISGALADVKTLSGELDERQGQMQQAVARVQSEYEPRIGKLQNRIQEMEALIEAGATFLKDRIDQGDDGGPRCADLTNGRIGWERSPGKVLVVKPPNAKKKPTLVQIAEKIKAKFAAFVTKPDPPKPTVNKDAVAAAFRAGDVTNAQLNRYGLHVEREDKFYYQCDAGPMDATPV